jgi:hypothetical protein
LKERRLKHDEGTQHFRVNDLYVLLASMNLYSLVRSMYLLRNLKDVYTGNKYIAVFRLKKMTSAIYLIISHVYVFVVKSAEKNLFKKHSLFVRL